MTDIDILLENLNSNDLEVVEDSLYLISEQRRPNSVQYVIPFLKHANVAIRETAVYCLGELHQDEAIEFIIEAISNDNNESVRSFAYYALDDYQDDRIETFLFECLGRSYLSKEHLEIIVRLLKHYPSDQARKYLSKILLESVDDHIMTIPAVDSLYAMNTDELKDDWKEIIDNTSDQYVSIIAHKAIVELEYKTSSEKLNISIFQNLNEFETVLEVFKLSIVLNDEKEVFFLNSLESERFKEFYVYGALSLEIHIAFVLIEKGTQGSLHRLKRIIKDQWSKFQIDRFNNLLEVDTELQQKYQKVE